jgi:hypothetical protein
MSTIRSNFDHTIHVIVLPAGERPSTMTQRRACSRARSTTARYRSSRTAELRKVARAAMIA